MSVSASPEQTHDQPGSLQDLHDKLVVLRTKPVWARWLHAGLLHMADHREWNSGRVDAINDLVSELPFHEQDIRIVATNGTGGLPRQAWGTQGLHPDRDRMRPAESPGWPLNEAQVIGSASLDLGDHHLLEVLNLAELGRHNSPVYALPVTDLAYLIQHEAADIVQQPSH
jgi:hypothetical protein